MTLAGSKRRADYAAVTRKAIVDAARSLFVRNGYFATKVDQIAEVARVAPKTVYAVLGGKQGLLKILIEEWDSAPAESAGLEQMPGLPDATAVLELLSASARSIVEDYGDVMRVLVAAAPHDATAAAGLHRRTARIRDAHAVVAEHLASRGELAPGIDEHRAADVLYYYFGIRSFIVLLDDNGWTLDEAERWLAQQCVAALLDPRPPRSPSA